MTFFFFRNLSHRDCECVYAVRVHRAARPQDVEGLKVQPEIAYVVPALLHGVRLPGGVGAGEVGVLDVGAVLSHGPARHHEQAAHAEAGEEKKQVLKIYIIFYFEILVVSMYEKNIV